MVLFKYATANISHIHNELETNKDFKATLFASAIAQDLEIRERFVKFANGLKKVAPKANDFTYFSAIFLHSAEASLIDQETGEIKKDAEGNPITAEWKIDKKGSWKWVCSDKNIKPYKNNNGDIFPEPELKKAYRKWVGRPLCKDHQSSSVDGIRGIIVDTYYDDKFKRVIGLCALDKINYPDLARKVSTGYATNVSMGTSVGTSICYDCGNMAKTEASYCDCVKGRRTYGEINIDLSPIELSLVVTPADPRAKLRDVIASLTDYSQKKEERIEELKTAGCITPDEFNRLEQELEQLKTSLKAMYSLNKQATTNPEKIDQARNLGEVLKQVTDPKVREIIEMRIKELLGEEIPPYGGEVQPVGLSENTAQSGEIITASNNNLNLQMRSIYEKLDAMENTLQNISIQKTATNDHKEEDPKMSIEERQARAEARRAMLKNAYHQQDGGEHDPKNTPFKGEDDKELREKLDRTMTGEMYTTTREDYLKGKVSKAEKDDRKMKRHGLLATAEETYKDDKGNTYVKTPEGVKKVTPVQSAEDDSAPTTFPVKSTYDGTVLKSFGEYTSYMDFLKRLGVQEDVKFETVKSAYFQGADGGVNDPKSLPYASDPVFDDLTKYERAFLGSKGDVGARDREIKDRLLRASDKLRAKFVLAFKDDQKKVIDKENSRWEIYAGADKVLEATGGEIYENELDENWEFLASKAYGSEVLKTLRKEGFDRVAYLLKGDKLTKTAQPPMPPVPNVPPVDDPMPPVEDPVEAPKDLDSDPVQSALDTLTEHLTETEKALGDLKDALQEQTGETGAELPSATEVMNDDGQPADDNLFQENATEVRNALDESADELALIAESLETRIKSGKGADDPLTSELLRISTSAFAENEQLRKEASVLVTSAKKKKEEANKKKSKKMKKEEEAEDKEETSKSKKSKAEEMLNTLLLSRASARREMARVAMENSAEDDEEMEKLKKEVEALMDAEKNEKNEEGKLEHPELQDLEVEEDEEQKAEDMGQFADDLDAQLAQLLDESNQATQELQASAQRRAWREKVAKEAVALKKTDLMGREWAPDVNTTELSPPSVPLSESVAISGHPNALVEGLVDEHLAILEILKRTPVNASSIQHLEKLLKAGAVTSQDLTSTNEEKLEALAVDPAIVGYLKLANEGRKTDKFAQVLNQEFENKKSKASLEEQRLKTRRAYEVAVEMQSKGMIPDGVEYLHAQADEIVQFDDKVFESFKKAVNRTTNAVKTASLRSTPAIQVGLNESNMTSGSNGTNEPNTLVDQLRKLWS